MTLPTMLKLKPHYALLLLLLMVSACGFHLRGSGPAVQSDITSVLLTESAASAVSNEVRAQLQMAGTAVSTGSTDKAEFSLHLSDQSIQRSILSINPATGKVDEYQLTFTVTMAISDPDQNEVLTNQVIRLVRDFAFDEDAVLGSVSEQRVLEEEMTRQAATQIIRRLNAVSRN
jgi:LPS-assembly lipoprotein